MDESTPTTAPRFEQIFQDAVQLQRRDADRVEQQRDRERRRRAQAQRNQHARRCLRIAEQRAEIFLRDVTDAPARRDFIQGLVKAGVALRRARGPATLETFLPPHAIPLPETVLGALLLPLRFLIELLRLGQRREREAIEALLLRLPETPALGRFVEWFVVAADFLCGMDELREGLRIQAPLPLPANDWSPATRAELLRILYASADLDPAVTSSEPVGQQATDWTIEPATDGTGPLLPSSPAPPAVGENQMSPPVRNVAADAVAAAAGPGTAVSEPEVDGPAFASSQPGAEPCRYVFRRQGQGWRLCFGEKERFLKDCRGLEYLARLLAQPDRPMDGVDVDPRRQELGVPPELTSDATARRKYGQYFAELCEDMENARRRNCEAEIKEIQEKMRELHRLVGSKRDRLGNSPQRAAWRAVKAAIQRAIACIRRELPELADHLDKTMQLRYEPAIYSPRADSQAGSVHWET
jgi:hypothetical protein